MTNFPAPPVECWRVKKRRRRKAEKVKKLIKRPLLRKFTRQSEGGKGRRNSAERISAVSLLIYE